MSDLLNYDEIKRMYEVNKWSWEQIAKAFDTYPNRIIRFVKKNGGVEKRSKSEAQSLSIKNGVRPHPTKGKKRSDEVKAAIANKQSENWSNLTDEERQRRSDIAKENWDKKSPEEIVVMRDKAVKGVLEASKSGSKFENYVLARLQNDGYIVEAHKEDLIDQEKVHIDLFLPELSLAIEIDGPAHFLPIWGEDKLLKHQQKDQRKNALLLYMKFTVLRVKCLTKTISKIKMEKSYEEIRKAIEDVKANPQTLHNTTIEITVQ